MGKTGPTFPKPMMPIFGTTEVVSMKEFLLLKATVSEELAQSPYMAAGVVFEPANLRTQGTELTTEPHAFSSLSLPYRVSHSSGLHLSPQ